jgi:two-component system sensor histidine kinase YesM
MKKRRKNRIVVRFLRRWRLRGRLMAAFLVFAFIPVLIVGSATYLNTYNENKETAIEYSKNIVSQMSNNVKSIYDDAMSRFRKILYSATVQNSILDYPSATTMYAKGVISNRIKDVLTETTGASTHVESVEVMTTECDRFVYGFGITVGDEATSELIATAHDKSAIFTQISKKELNYDDKYYLIFGKQLKDQGIFSTNDTSSLLTEYGSASDDSGRSDVIGYAFMSVRLDDIERLRDQSSAGESQYLVVTDENGNIIAHPNGDLVTSRFDPETVDRIYNNTEEIDEIGHDSSVTKVRESGHFYTDINGENALVTYEIIPTNNWIILNVMSVAAMTETTRHNGVLTAWTAVVSMALAIMCAVVVTRSISDPVDNMLSAMDAVGEGNLNVKIMDGDESGDEHGQLSERFNDMVQQLKKLIDEVYKARLKESKLEFLRKEAELNALQQQINPHFLYNTLESIFWEAEERGAEEISEMVTALGNFFRSSINKGLAFVRIEEEVAGARNYIYLQKIRFLDRFRVVWSIDKEILKYKTLKLVLQPIIENAIVHGVENMSKGGMIHISGRKIGDVIEMCVVDNGQGIKEDELERLRQYINEDQSDVTGHIGIKNVNQRIKLYFGNQYGLQLDSEYGKGTRVTIRFLALLNDTDILPGRPQ